MSEDKASLEYLGGIALVKVVHAAAKQWKVGGKLYVHITKYMTTECVQNMAVATHSIQFNIYEA